jgi:signal peptidase I
MMHVKKRVKQFWTFLKEDTWQSWVVSMVLAFVLIKYLFFPTLSFMFATPLPIVVVESCSMYHANGFDSWWASNGEWYDSHGMDKETFGAFPFRNGLNKGDIVFVSGRRTLRRGDVAIFNAQYRYPLIHRLIRIDPYDTKGDNNFAQLPGELDIQQDQFIGRAVWRLPGLGWIKLIFFEGLKPKEQRGFCK